MHRLQQQIVYSLAKKSKLRYSQIKPPSVEGNLFMYHLKKLIDQGLVRKTDMQYQLTSKGKALVDKLSLETFEPRIQPKIVTLIACKNRKGEFLLYKRKREPFSGLVGFPYGKIHLGETLAEAAKREFKEKTGLSGKFTHRGDVYLTIFEDGDLISQMLCHVFSAVDPKGQLKENSVMGRCFFERIERIDKKGYLPGLREIYHLIEASRKHFFTEFTYRL